MRRKKKYSFWKRLHFKYRISVINESTLTEIWKIRASIFSGALLVFLFALFLITITSIIIITTPIRYYLPGYLDSEIREKALRSAIKIDSIEQQIGYQNAYNESIKNILAGKIDVDSIKSDTLGMVTLSENDPLLQKTRSEKEYVDKYEEEERYNLSVLPTATNMPVGGILFFKPVRGFVSKKYAPQKDFYGISIKVTGRETVCSIQEGTIIFTTYDINDGYTIQIQHKSGFVSVYKHIGILLKDIGSQVKTGEAIAIINNIKNKVQDGDNMYLELWYKGRSVNPENYIFF